MDEGDGIGGLEEGVFGLKVVDGRLAWPWDAKMQVCVGGYQCSSGDVDRVKFKRCLVEKAIDDDLAHEADTMLG